MRSVRVIPAVIALFLAAATAVPAQEEAELRGTVVSAETGDEVAGAWIALEGYGWGTFSWNDGHFYLPDIPNAPRQYEVEALGYEGEVLTLDPGEGELVLELTPDPELLEGVAFFMDQLQRRRNRGGQLRVFDREDLAFNASFTLGEYLQLRGVDRLGRVCVDERPEPVGVLGRASDMFYMAEIVGGFVRLYTEEFVEEAARERYRLHPEPRICRGPVGRG